MRGYVLHAGEGTTDDAGLKASRASTGGSFTLIESDADGGAPAHVEFVAGPRAFVFLPRGVRHDRDVRGRERPS